jgi:uncharacterized RDD family membrane protein YckC
MQIRSKTPCEAQTASHTLSGDDSLGAEPGMPRPDDHVWWRYRLTLAPVWLRLAALVVDVTLVVAVVGGYFWFFEGFGATAISYFDEDLRGTLPPRAFVTGLTRILGVSFLLGLLYGVFGDGSPWMGTVGKRLVGIRVTDEYGERITLTTSIIRNLMKIVACAPLGLGCLAACWNPAGQAWHDRVAHTFVARG